MLGLTLSAAIFAIVAQTAQAHSGPVLATLQSLAAPKAEATPQPTYTLVWEGRDVDGDGAADFANPTGEAMRQHDDFGYGHYGARRDGGGREHEGVDYTGVAGQSVSAPMSGFITKIGMAYGDGDLKFVEIWNPALGYEARVFYIDPAVQVGDVVKLGAPIGALRSLQARYPGITNHVHLEVKKGGQRFDAGQMITSRWLPDNRG